MILKQFLVRLELDDSTRCFGDDKDWADHLKVAAMALADVVTTGPRPAVDVRPWNGSAGSSEIAGALDNIDAEMKTRAPNPAEQWLLTEDGRSCANILTLEAPSRFSPYLKNRLLRAFRAGWDAAQKERRKSSDVS